MSHVKTVHAFEKLTGHCTGFGGSYKPGQQHLQANALNALLLNAQQILNASVEAKAGYDKVTNEREILFERVGKLSSRVCSMLEASKANALMLEDARRCCRKLRGKGRVLRAPLPSGEGVVPASRTVYGSDFISKVQHFAHLVEVVKNCPTYPATDEAMSLDNLEQVLQNMRAANQAVTQAEVNLALARKTRNEVLYTGENSLTTVSQGVKQYVRAVFGYESPEFSALTRLRL